MRILAIVVAAIVALAASVGVIFALRDGGADDGGAFFASLIASGLIYPAVGAGLAIGASDARAPDAARTARRIALGLAGMQVVTAIGLVVYAIVNGLPPAVVVLLVSGALGLTALYAAGGRAWRERRTIDTRDDRPFTAAEMVTKRRRIAATGVVTFVVILAAGAVFFGIDELATNPVAAGGWALGIAFITAAAAATVVSLGLLGRLQRASGGDRMILRAVLKNRPGMLRDDQRLPSARYAALYHSYLPFQTMQFVLLFGGLVLLQGVGLADDDSPGPTTVIVRCAFLVAVAVSIPLYASQHRNVRRYAADSAHLLADTRVEG
jgi:hypothetical protein